MKCKCLLETFNLLTEIFALIWQHCLLHSYPLSHSSCKHMAVDLKSNSERTNFISAFYKLTILTENNVHFLIGKKRRKRLFPTFVQTLVWNMTFFCTVIYGSYQILSKSFLIQNSFVSKLFCLISFKVIFNFECCFSLVCSFIQTIFLQ